MPDDTGENVLGKKKAHRERKAGRKQEKKKKKNEHVQELTAKQRNPKAFAFNSTIQAERRFRRKKDIETKKQHIPVINRSPVEPPPVVVAIVGPPKVGKTTLLQNLIKHFTRQPLASIKGPVTVVTGKKQRITLMECNNDINSMIDTAKVADLILLLVDASFGFEMEVFEFLNICQVHGMPRILGVLTHLDLLKNNKQLKKTKKILKHRFWTEVYQGAKLFYLSGILHGEYLNNDIRNLGRFISVIKFRPLVWRTTHPYILVDRMEDITDPEHIRQNALCDRDLCLYGYVRGVALNKDNSLHIPGCGDTRISNIDFLTDPCPLPERKKRSLFEKERLIYAPFSGVGGIVYDKDAVYVELAGSHSFQEKTSEGKEFVNSILAAQEGIDVKRDKSELKFFTDSKPIISSEFERDQDAVTEMPNENDKESENEYEYENEIKNAVEDVASGDKTKGEKLHEDEDSDDEEDEAEEEENEIKSEGVNGHNYFEETVETDGRVRRKVVFKEEIEEFDSENDSDSSEDEHDADMVPFRGYNKDAGIKSKITEALKKLDNKVHDSESSSDESGIELEAQQEGEKRKLSVSESYDEDRAKKLKTDSKDSVNSDNDDYETSAVKWKDNLAQKASDAFIERQNSTQNLFKLVYGGFKRLLDANQTEDEKVDEEEIGGIFRLVSEKQRQRVHDKEILDEEDTSLFRVTLLRDWTNEKMKPLIKDCFVTGKWKKTEDAEELLKLDDLPEDEWGDFEDLETGEKHLQNTEETEKTETREQLLERKKKLKEKFDAEYDEKEEYSYYNDLKAQVDQQAQLNKSEFEGLPDDVRVEIEGYRPGMYVRLKLTKMPCELVENFDPNYPLIVGGLLPIEENIGFLQVRLKKHRWYNKILKTKDPLIVSLGWRRFQTLPIYSKLEDNMRYRMLKYTPQHVSCVAHMYGPITPQGTGVLAVQNVAVRTPGFRIACTGTVIEVDKSTTITKKLKLVGTPQKIYKKTAFIQGMFTSTLEVGKFEGAKIRTVSGIRGIIKKAVSKPEGGFRATFEDKIKLSDIIFCRTWYPVEVPKLYNPVTSLLLPPDEKAAWQGMKTLGELKRENNIKMEAQSDSLYTPIERKPKQYRPLVIPKQLQKSLPYKDKSKAGPRETKNIEEGRIAVIREPYEEKVAHLLKVIKTNFAHKKKEEKTAMIHRVNKHKKVLREQEARKFKRQKEIKKQVFRTLSKMDKAKNKKR